jgi:hypothetical protein
MYEIRKGTEKMNREEYLKELKEIYEDFSREDLVVQDEKIHCFSPPEAITARTLSLLTKFLVLKEIYEIKKGTEND